MDDIRVIGLDADDTLWECGTYYADVSDKFCDFISNNASVSYDDVCQKLDEIEMKNMPILGYGAKAMTISMIETAIAINPDIKPDDILKCIDLGKSLLDMPVKMLKDVEKTVRTLAKKFRILIITQGDIAEQRRKFDKSPFPNDYEFIVVPEKTSDAYFDILKRRNIHPNNFLMVGDSPKSDIMPVIDLGCYAAYLPTCKTWSFERLGIVKTERLFQINQFSDLLNLLRC